MVRSVVQTRSAMAGVDRWVDRKVCKECKGNRAKSTKTIGWDGG